MLTHSAHLLKYTVSFYQHHHQQSKSHSRPFLSSWVFVSPSFHGLTMFLLPVGVFSYVNLGILVSFILTKCANLLPQFTIIPYKLHIFNSFVSSFVLWSCSIYHKTNLKNFLSSVSVLLSSCFSKSPILTPI